MLFLWKARLKKITDNVVEDIPGSLFTCFYNGQEVRLWACSPEYVELRVQTNLHHLAGVCTFPAIEAAQAIMRQ